MHIFWFRRDLRLSDNEIIALSTADKAEVLPCFIIDPWFYGQAEVGKARVKFLFESLSDLDSNLRARGSQLYLFEGNSLSVIQELTRQLLKQKDRPKLFFNYDVQVQYGIERDCFQHCRRQSPNHRFLPPTQSRLPLRVKQLSTNR